MFSDDGLPVAREQTRSSMYITSDWIWQCGPKSGCPKCRPVARGDSINQTLPHSRACRERIEGLVGNDLSSRDRLSRDEEIKTRDLTEHLEKKFGSRPQGVTHTTPCADSANAQNMQDKTGSSSSVVPPKGYEPSSDECAVPVAKRSLANDVGHDPGEIPIPAAHSDQLATASGRKRSGTEESCEMDTDDSGGARAARRARLALVEQMVLQLHRMLEEEESNATHDDPYFDPELIIHEEDSVNHKMDEENFDRKLVAVAKEEELRKFEKLKVHEVVSKEEFRRDLEAINIGTCGLPVAIWFKVF